MAQAVSYQPLKIEAQIQIQDNRCGNCAWKRVLTASVFSFHIIPLRLCTHISLISHFTLHENTPFSHGLHAQEVPWTVKSQCMKLQPSRKNEIKGTRDTPNIHIHKLINKHANIWAPVYYKDVNIVHGQKLRSIKQQTEWWWCGWQRGLTEETGKPQLLCLLVHVLTHFLLWCQDSLILILKFQTYTHKMDNLKEVTKSLPFRGPSS